MAEQEVRQLYRSLPEALRIQAQALPVTYDARSTDELDQDGTGDTLGLFVGANYVEEAGGGPVLPAQIILYLQNIWWEAEQDEGAYRREVRTTLLHELGHYLGLEEIDLEDRGL